MYILIVVLTMLAAPIASIFAEHALKPATPMIFLAGRWFVFWGVGVRLGLAGMRQVIQPSFTARNIFHMSTDEALPLVRELGVANIGTAVVALISIAAPSFVLPAAISATLFYAVAGLTHLAERARSLNENIAMVSDVFMAFVLVSVLITKVAAF